MNINSNTPIDDEEIVLAVKGDDKLKNLTDLEKAMVSGNVTPVQKEIIDKLGLSYSLKQQQVEKLENIKPVEVVESSIEDIDPVKAGEIKKFFDSIQSQANETAVTQTQEVRTEVENGADLPKPKTSSFSNVSSDISDEDKRNWVRATLGNLRFIKRYSFFNDRYWIEFRTRTFNESRAITDSAADMYDASDSSTMLKRAVLEPRYKLVTSIHRIKNVDQEFPSPLEYDTDKENPFEAATDGIMGNWNSTLFNVVVKSFEDFERLVDQLSRESNNPNFWEQI